MKELFWKEVAASSLYRNLAWLIMIFFDDEILYAHYFSAEVCDSTWYSYQCIVDWKPKDFITKWRAYENGRGRVLEATKVDLTTPYCTDDIPNLGVPLFSSVKISDLRSFSTRFQMTGAFYLLCQFDKVHAVYVQLLWQSHKNFIAKSLLSIRNSGGSDCCAP